jgi:hypothetical protein
MFQCGRHCLCREPDSWPEASVATRPNFSGKVAGFDPQGRREGEAAPAGGRRWRGLGCPSGVLLFGLRFKAGPHPTCAARQPGLPVLSAEASR